MGGITRGGSAQDDAMRRNKVLQRGETCVILCNMLSTERFCANKRGNEMFDLVCNIIGGLFGAVFVLLVTGMACGFAYAAVPALGIMLACIMVPMVAMTGYMMVSDAWDDYKHNR